MHGKLPRACGHVQLNRSHRIITCKNRCFWRSNTRIVTGGVLFRDDYSTEKRGNWKKSCDNFRTQYLKISYGRVKNGRGNIWFAYLTLGYVSRLLLKRCRRNKYLPAIFTFIIVSVGVCYLTVWNTCQQNCLDQKIRTEFLPNSSFTCCTLHSHFSNI